jgi:hypothetical protein
MRYGQPNNQPLKVRFDFFPNAIKEWSRLNVVPGNSMNIRKNKFFVRWTNQVNSFVSDLIIFNPHQTNGACAIAVLIRSFEVNRQKFE